MPRHHVLLLTMAIGCSGKLTVGAFQSQPVGVRVDAPVDAVIDQPAAVFTDQPLDSSTDQQVDAATEQPVDAATEQPIETATARLQIQPTEAVLAGDSGQMLTLTVVNVGEADTGSLVVDIPAVLRPLGDTCRDHVLKPGVGCAITITRPTTTGCVVPDVVEVGDGTTSASARISCH